MITKLKYKDNKQKHRRYLTPCYKQKAPRFKLYFHFSFLMRVVLF
jgi:hypothetical protein